MHTTVPSLKDETSIENSWNRCRSYCLPLVSRIFLGVSSLIFFFLTNADVVLKFVKPMEVKLRSKMSHWPKILRRYEFQDLEGSFCIKKLHHLCLKRHLFSSTFKHFSGPALSKTGWVSLSPSIGFVGVHPPSPNEETSFMDGPLKEKSTIKINFL